MSANVRIDSSSRELSLSFCDPLVFPLFFNIFVNDDDVALLLLPLLPFAKAAVLALAGAQGEDARGVELLAGDSVDEEETCIEGNAVGGVVQQSRRLVDE